MIVPTWYLLLVHTKPIIAEHPLDITEITAIDVNLENITDNRMQHMFISGKVEFEKKIPQVIDLASKTTISTLFRASR